MRMFVTPNIGHPLKNREDFLNRQLNLEVKESFVSKYKKFNKF